MQIEKKKINHVPVNKAIGKISQDSREKKCQRKIAPTIRYSRSQEKAQNYHKRHARNGDKERIVASEGSERCAVIGHVNKTEEIRYQNMRLIRTDEPQDHPLGQLIQCVERKRKEQDEFHAGIDPANAQRPTPNVQRPTLNAGCRSIER